MPNEIRNPNAEVVEELPPRLPPTDRPDLDRLSIIQWEWGEAEERWFEIVTGESIAPDERAPRNSHL